MLDRVMGFIALLSPGQRLKVIRFVNRRFCPGCGRIKRRLPRNGFGRCPMCPSYSFATRPAAATPDSVPRSVEPPDVPGGEKA